MSFLQVMWFLLIGVLLTIYAILDGYDLGIGIWHLSTKKEKHRKTMLALLGPVWDGNEVWLLTGGGAIFAAFPEVYATVFSGFYLPLFIVIMALIARAVAIEFRNQHEHAVWRKVWDVAFASGSIVPSILFGVAVGNLMTGIPLDHAGTFIGSIFTLLNPYSLVIGLLSFAMFATHGAIYVAARTHDELKDKAIQWAKTSWFAYLNVFMVVTIYTMTSQPRLIDNYLRIPVLTGVPFLTFISLVAIYAFLKRRELTAAFITSAVTIAGIMAIFGVSMFPTIVQARDSGNSLTIYNASSSALTLQTMLILAILVVPVVIGYTLWSHRQFWRHSPDEGY